MNPQYLLAWVSLEGGRRICQALQKLNLKFTGLKFLGGESMNSFIKRTGVAIAMLLASATIASTAAAEPVVIRIGWNQAPGHPASFIYSDTSLLPHYGKSYVIEPVRFGGGGEQITALATGDVDLAALGASAMVSAIQNAGLDIRAVADVLRDGEPGYFTHPYIVKADSGIEEVKDLRGKRLATNQIGSSSDMGLRAALRAAGLQDTDVTSVEVAFSNHPSFIRQGTVDLITALPQFRAEFAKDPKYRTLFTMRDAVGVTQTVALVARAEFIEKNRDALVDFFADHIKVLQHYSAPENRDATLAAIGAVTGAPPESFSYALTKDDFYHDPEGRLSLEGLQRAVDLAVQLGLIAPLDVKDYVDGSLIEDAVARLDK
jgi:sulfonate transport system substrate-binding protein